jgi:hypothetical protein
MLPGIAARRRKRPFMSSDTARLARAVLVFASLTWAHSQLAFGQDDCKIRREYTAASLHGDYAAVATYGADVARALGVQTLDGLGNVKGSAIVNQPGLNGTRKIVSITFTGSYTVQSNGTGTMFLTINLPNGSTANATEDFVITSAKLRNGIPIATEIVDAQEQPSTVIPGGVFVTHTYTLRPE